MCDPFDGLEKGRGLGLLAGGYLGLQQSRQEWCQGLGAIPNGGRGQGHVWLGLWPRPSLSVQTHIDRALPSTKPALTPRPRLLCQCPAPESSTESSGSHQDWTRTQHQHPVPSTRTYTQRRFPVPPPMLSTSPQHQIHVTLSVPGMSIPCPVPV